MKSPADLYAAAVVASARTFGDCPIEAVTSPTSQKRRSLAPAAYAVSNATDRSLRLACATLGVRVDSARRAFSAARKPWPTDAAKTWRNAWMAAFNSIRSAL